MKIKEKYVRTIIVNIIIILTMFAIFSLTTVGNITSVFSSSTYQVIYRGNKNNNNVSLMFNVYQGTEYIEDILKILKSSEVKATFFVGGCWVVKNSEVLKQIYDNGHEIANHGYWHKDHKILSAQKNLEEMQLTHTIVKEILKYEIQLFAPPSGSYSSTTIKIAQNMGYKTIMWSKDTIDWRDQDKGLIFSRATNKPQNGDLILMHPTKCTVDALSDIISFYNQSGYNLTTVSQNIL